MFTAIDIYIKKLERHDRTKQSEQEQSINKREEKMQINKEMKKEI